MRSSQRAVASCAAASRWLVTWMKWPVGVPAVDDLDRARVGHGGEDHRLAVGLGDADGELVLPQAGDPVGRLDLVGQRDAEAPAGGVGEDVPVVVEGRVDVEGDPHGRRGRGTAAADYAGGTMTTASPPRRRPVDLDAYGPQGRSPWLDVDWRAHQRWVEVGGRAVNVIDLGSGPPVVFVHGLAGSWQNWLEQLPVLAEDHRVIALDLPGFGQSPMPSRDDLDRRLRAPRRGRARRPRPRRGRARGQLDGRLHRGRGRDPVPGARRAPRARERRGPVDRVPAQRARPARPAARRAPADGLGRLARVALGHPGPRAGARGVRCWASSRSTPSSSPGPCPRSSCTAAARRASSTRSTR